MMLFERVISAAIGLSKKPKKGVRKKAVKKVPKKAVVQVISNWRYLSVYTVGVVLLLLLIVKAATLQVVPDVRQGYAFLQDEGVSRTVRKQVVPAYRGSITDRNGSPLAISTPMHSLWINPQLINQSQVPEIAKALNIDAKKLKSRLQHYKNKQFMFLRRGMIPADADAVMKNKFAGIYVQKEFRRFYPEAEVTAQLLGLTGIEDQGLEGLELGYDQILSGKAGKELIVQDLRGRRVERLGILDAVEVGKDLQLSIDIRLQYVAYRSLKKAVNQQAAAFASMIIMNPQTGEILAMVSQPSFNPNSREKLDPRALRNRPLVDRFEPGSTVKPFSIMAALEQDMVSEKTRIDTSPGYIYVDGKLIEDLSDYGELNVASVLAKSSQVGMVKITQDMDPDRLHLMYQRVGLGESPGLGFPGELSGKLPHQVEWSYLEKASFSYGYGLEVTSVQLAQAYSLLANGGKLVTPILIKNTAVPPPENRVDEQLVLRVRSMMEKVVLEGTGKKAAVKGFRVAGKTGTGHLVGVLGYERNKYASLFAGMVPADDPKLVAVVVFTDPQGGDYFGGAVAAPVFAEVMTESLRILGIEQTEPSQTSSVIAAVR